MTDRWNTRKTLLQRVQDQDDKGAWGDFVFFYHDFLKMVLLKMSLNVSDTEDIIQEVLLKLWKALPNFTTEGKAKFRTWLSVIIRNSAIDYLRKHKKIDSVELTEESYLKIDEPKIAELIQNEWEIHIVSLALLSIKKQFSENAIEVFEMAMKNVATSDIALKLDLTENAVLKLKNRVKHKMIQEISDLRQKLEYF
jgi:RNA polymerase sigma factor (sigma-70 family)